MSTITHESRSRTWPQRSNRVQVPTGIAPPLDGLAEEWLARLQAEHKSIYTQRLYVGTVADLAHFLANRGMPTDPLGITGEHVREYLNDQFERGLAAKTVWSRYTYLRSFFAWLLDENEITAHPMARMKPPKLGERPPAMVTDDQFAAVLAACRGSTWEDKRDEAVIRLLESTGVRRAELAAVLVADLDLAARIVRVHGKGDAWRDVRFDTATQATMYRYRRERAKHRNAALPQFFLTRMGAMSANSVGEVVAKRCRVAGLVDGQGRELVHPHMFRHRFADRWKAAGGSEEGLMAIGGWKNPEHMKQYGRTNRTARALEEYDRVRE